MDVARLVSAWPLLLLLLSWCPPGTQSTPDHPESDRPDSDNGTDLAEVLGLPKYINGTPRLPPSYFMMELYRNVTGQHGNGSGQVPYNASVVRNTEESAPLLASTMRFAVEPIPIVEELLAAELRVHLLAAAAARLVRVQQETEAGLGQPLNTTLVPAAGGLAVLQVGAALANWTGGNLTLRMTEKTPGGQWRLANVTRQGRHKPLLVLYSLEYDTEDEENDIPANATHSASHHRTRRSAGSTAPPGCQRRVLDVNFTTLGMSNYILLPRHYDAGQCVGQCRFPLGSGVQKTERSLTMSLLHSQSPSKYPAPCCASNTYANIRALVYDSRGGLMLKNLKGISTTACTCR